MYLEGDDNGIDFNENDFHIEEQDMVRARIQELQNEIKALVIHLRVPRAVGLGMVLAGLAGQRGLGAIGMAALGSAGFYAGMKSELNEEQKRRIIDRIMERQGELERLMRKDEIEDKRIGGIMNAGDLMQYQYESYPFAGKWEELFGEPSKTFHCMVFGKPKQGKSIFAVQFANYLSEFGPVLYVAAEEGFSATLQKKIRDYGSNPNLDFADYRSYEQIESCLRNSDYKFCVIDSINFINLTPEDIEELKAQNPTMAFVTIQQATKNGSARGSQQFAHNCDMVVEVINGVAHHMGRFQGASEMQVWENAQESKRGPVRGPKPANNDMQQMEMDFGHANFTDEVSGDVDFSNWG